MMRKKVCLAFPCFNPSESQWVALEQYKKRVAQAAPAWQFEFVVVDDGSPQWCEPPVALKQEITLVKSQVNQGKGGALKLAVGAMSEDAAVFVFTDFDLPYSVIDLISSCSSVFAGADLCIGDRTAYFFGNQRKFDRLSRGFAHRLFRLFSRTVVAGGIADTQCGLKAFDAHAVRHIAASASIHSFLFDVEWLYIALRHKLCVRCLPVTPLDAHESGRLRSMNYKCLLRDGFVLLRRIITRTYDSETLVQWLNSRINQAVISATTMEQKRSDDSVPIRSS